MIDSLIYFSIKNNLIIGLGIVALVIWGGYSLVQLPVDAVPDITTNQIQILTLTPTLAAQEVEQFVTTPIELSLANIPDITEIRSVSKLGLSVVTVVFKDEVDISTRCHQNGSYPKLVLRGNFYSKTYFTDCHYRLPNLGGRINKRSGRRGIAECWA